MTAEQGVPCGGIKRLGQGIERQIWQRMGRPEGQRYLQGPPALQRQRHPVAHCILRENPNPVAYSILFGTQSLCSRLSPPACISLCTGDTPDVHQERAAWRAAVTGSCVVTLAALSNMEPRKVKQRSRCSCPGVLREINVKHSSSVASALCCPAWLGHLRSIKA